MNNNDSKKYRKKAFPAAESIVGELLHNIQEVCSPNDLGWMPKTTYAITPGSVNVRNNVWLLERFLRLR